MGPPQSASKIVKKRQPNPALWPKAEARVAPLEFRRAPLLWAAGCFALGEVLARQWHAPMVLVVATVLLVLLTAMALRVSLRVALLPLAGVWIVAGVWGAQVQPLPSTQRELASYADGLSRQVRGRVVRIRELPARRPDASLDKEPGWWPEKEESEEATTAGMLSVDLQLDAIEEVTPDVSRMVPIAGGVRLNILPGSSIHDASGAVPGFHCGEMIEVPARLKLAERYNDPGAWQYADYLLAQGIGAHATVRAAKIGFVEAVQHAGWAADDVQCRVFAAQNWASERLLGYVQSPVNRRMPKVLQLSGSDAGMINAMLFGDRTGLDRSQRVGFERTGSFHLFVVSGMHVALIAGLVFWAARRLGLREWIATPLTLLITFMYALVTGFGAPVQRALFMTAIFLLARLLFRERGVLNALGAAALGVLVWSPSALFEASFQMTFLAILAIGGIAVPLGERTFLPYAQAAGRLRETRLDITFPPRVAQFRMMLRMWSELFADAFGGWTRRIPADVVRFGLSALELALIGLVAECVMVLPMAVYFHRATVFAVPTNMLSIPLVALLVPMAVAAFCCSLAGPLVAVLPAAATALLLHGVAAILGRVSAMRLADMRVPPPALWVAIVAICAWFFCCWAVRRSSRWAMVGAVLLPVVAAAVLWPERADLKAGTLEVTAIDVGQGDSIFVAAPNGATMLIDAGGPVGGVTEAAQATSRFDVGEEIVSPYLWSRGVRRLDVLALSHAHSDHMGGMPAVMRNFRPRELWVSIDPDSDEYRALLAEARELGVTVRHLYAGDTVRWSGMDVTVLAPERGYANPGAPINNDSLVLRVQYGAASALLEGDAEAPSEATMLAEHRVAPVTLLKVGHHGSRTSTTQAFLDAAAPRDAVVSVGRGNTFGHPRGEVIARIAAARTKLYRTDEFGLTTFLLEPDGRVRELVGASN